MKKRYGYGIRKWTGEVDIVKGEMKVEHEDIKSESNLIPFSVRHIYKNEETNKGYGKGIRINLEQTIKKENDIYVYEDGRGEKEEFKEKYYYRDEENKRKYEKENGEEIKREDVEYGQDGELKYEGKKVYQEYQSERGLKIITDKEGYKNNKEIEERQEDIGKLEDEIEEIKRVKEDLEYNLKEYNKYDNVKYNEMISKQKQVEQDNIGEEEKTHNRFDDKKLIYENYYIAKEAYEEGTGKEKQSGVTRLVSNKQDGDDEEEPHILLKEIEASTYRNKNARLAEKYNLKAQYNNSTSGDENGEIDNAIWSSYYSQLYNDDVEKLVEELKYYENELQVCDWNQQDEAIGNRKIMLENQKGYLNARDAYEGERTEETKEYYKKLIERTENQIEKYNILLNTKEYELEELKKQMPITYISDGEMILGFNSYGKLSMIFDTYENRVLIEYNEKEQIKEIIDSNEGKIEFKYNEEGKLVSIVDVEERETKYEYDELGYLTKVIYSNKEESKIEYKNGKLEKILEGKKGYRVEYEEDKVIKVVKLGETKEKKEVEIEYKEKETIITDTKTGIKGHYLYDEKEEIVVEYEEDEEKIEKVVTYDYENEHCKIKVVSKMKEENLVKVGEIKTGTKQEIEVEVSKLKGGVTEYILSGYAKARSKEVTDRRKTEYCDHIKVEETQAHFDIRCELIYEDETNPREFIGTYDYKKEDKQYMAVPVTLREDENGMPIKPDRIKVVCDYRNNNGECEYSEISLRVGEYVYEEYDSEHNKIFECSNEVIVDKVVEGEKQGKYVIKVNKYYEYEEKNLIEERQEIKKEEIKGEEIVEGKREEEKVRYIYNKENKVVRIEEEKVRYTYNKENELVKVEEEKGNIKENEYNESGLLVKSRTYNKSNPTISYYEEIKRNEKGQVEVEYDEIGNEIRYEYKGKTNKVEGIIDERGRLEIGLDYHTDEVIAITKEVEGISNSNEIEYVEGKVKEVRSNSSVYTYEYDEFEEIKGIKINGEEYVENSTKEEGEYKYYKTIYNTKEGYERKEDKYGKVLEVKKIKGEEEKLYKRYEYDEENLVKEVTYQEEGNEERRYEYDEEGKVLLKIVEEEYEKTSDNDIDGNEIKRRYKYEDKEVKYGYEYSGDKKLKKVKYQEEEIEKIEYDKLGRVEGIEDTIKKEKYEYQTKNGHTTGMIKKVVEEVGGKINYRKYKYDISGNIEEIKTKNNNIRYKYDGLGRLEREDNRILGESKTYEYDRNGNIICRTKYEYSLEDELENGVETRYNYSNLESDKLERYNDEKIEYDSIGNPEIYRNKKLDWDIRNLVKYEDIEFRYNGSNIRTGKKTKNKTHKYILEGTRILKEEVSEYKSYIDEYINEGETISKEVYEISYIYGSRGVIGFEVIRGEEVKRYYYNKNILGDIEEIYDDLGRIVGRYEYDGWGNHKITINEEEIARINPMRYRSYYYDEETGLYYCNARYYDPEVGRFINMDDISYLDPETIGGLNLYAYCLNNPVMYTDSDGLCLSGCKPH